MGSGPRADAGTGAPAISVKVRKTIQSIKEIVGNHSDGEIYAMLKETGMDPNEATQKLLNQDPFHEVKRRRDKKKENTNYPASSGPIKHVGNANVAQFTKSQSTWDRKTRRGVQTTQGLSSEFRVVRDNRVNRNANGPVQQESSGKGQSLDIQEKRQPNMQGYASNNNSRSRSIGHKRHDYSGRPAKEVKGTVSDSDPVHVPSPESRTAGAIRREVCVCRPASECPVSQPSLSNDSVPVPHQGKDVSAVLDSAAQASSLSKSIEFSQPEPEPVISSVSVVRPLPSNQYSGKMNPQPVGHQKVTQSTMEWKPKLNKKPSVSTSIATSTSLAAAPISTPDVDAAAPNVESTCLSDKLSHVNVHENEHVIIPRHLRVPESERAHLVFGSFEVGFDSPKDFSSAIEEFEDLKDPVNEPASRPSGSIPTESSIGVSAEEKADFDGHTRTSQSNSPASTGELEKTSSDNSNTDSLRAKSSEDYTDTSILRSHSPSQSPQEQHRLQSPPTLPTLSEAYDGQNNYDMPIFRTIDDTIRGQGLSTSSEVLSSHLANSGASSTVPMIQQPPLTQQPLTTQIYPPMHFSQFPNYLQYRQILSPMYVPPMAVPNYSSNPGYPHPSNGSGYVMMPGGNSQLTASGLKYGGSQYKPAPTSSPAGYGNYTNPAGFPMNGPGTVNAGSSLDDLSRIKYKDSNFFSNPQAETSEIWVQPQRDVPGMQSAPYFNIPGQLQHAPYLQTPGNHASFNAAPQSHMFQGLYQTPQQAAIASPHHLVHQPVPTGIGGNVGIGVTTPTPQMGTYQQAQLGHPNWTGNF